MISSIQPLHHFVTLGHTAHTATFHVCNPRVHLVHATHEIELCPTIPEVDQVPLIQ